jgi:hypothetical protein
VGAGSVFDELGMNARQSKVILSGVEGSRRIIFRFRHEIENLASPRMVSGLRCSLDFARNDGSSK